MSRFSNSTERNNRFIIRGTGVLGVILLVILTVFIYFPGISDVLLPDDKANLGPLFEINEPGVIDIAYFSLSGTSGPSGRPVSYFSFALQYLVMGDDIRLFKFVNLIIHILNGGLMALIAFNLLSRIYPHAHNNNLAIAIGACILWILHPLNVNTVLYVVQRMAVLSGFFSLLALLFFIKFRAAAECRQHRREVFLFITILVFTVLAVLSKETGILVFGYMALIEFVFFSSIRSSSKYIKTSVFILATIPFFILISYTDFSTVYSTNSGQFSAIDRLLTESRVLWMYIGQIFMPDISKMYLFHDDIIPSRGFLSPTETSVAILFIVLVTAFSFVFRLRLPIIGFGIIFFLIGHLLESTTLRLELYQEHRNYIPMFGLLMLLSWILLSSELSKFRLARKIVFLTLACLFSWLTFQNSSLWENEQKLAFYWAKNNVNSFSAQSFLAEKALRYGQKELALEQVEKAIELQPESVFSYLNSVLVKCVFNQGIQDHFLQNMIEVARTSEWSKKLPAQIHTFLQLVTEKRCPGVTNKDALGFLEALRANNRLTNPSYKAFAWEAEAFLLSRMYPDDLTRAEVAIRKSIDIAPTVRAYILWVRFALIDNNVPVAKTRLRETQEYITQLAWVQRLNRRGLSELENEIIQYERNNSNLK